MSDNGCGAFDAGMHLMQVWSDYASKMASAGASLSPQAPAPDMARDLRSAMLDAWARSWDQFLRSPQFLGMTQQSMAAVVDWRKQMNDCLGELQHQFQGASRKDVDQIMLGLRHLEHRMVDVVEDLGARLEEISARLDALEADSPPAGEEPGLNGRGGAPLGPDRKRGTHHRGVKKKDPADL
jgi:hypothetical protein